LRLDLQFGAASAELILDCAAASEEDVVAVREDGVPDSELTWRRHGRNTSIQTATGVRAVERHGNDVQNMLARFRDFVLGTGAPAATLEEAIDVMRTARNIVEALEAAGAPFDRVTAPRHVKSPSLQQAFR
jgi:hypothetical protein